MINLQNASVPTTRPLIMITKETWFCETLWIDNGHASRIAPDLRYIGFWEISKYLRGEWAGSGPYSAWKSRFQDPDGIEALWLSLSPPLVFTSVLVNKVGKAANSADNMISYDNCVYQPRDQRFELYIPLWKYYLKGTEA